MQCTGTCAYTRNSAKWIVVTLAAILSLLASVVIFAPSAYAAPALEDDETAIPEAQGDYMWFFPTKSSDSKYTFNVHGKYKGKFIQTTWSDNGYFTGIQVDNNSKTFIKNTKGFQFGKVYTNNNIQLRIKAGFQNNGREVKLTYDVHNLDSTAHAVKIGSGADTQIGDNDSAMVRFIDNNNKTAGIVMTDNNTSFNTYGAQFKVIADSDTPPTTTWYGQYNKAWDNIWNQLNSTTPFNGDSMVAWSFQFDLQAGETVSKSIVIAIDSVLEIGDVDVSTNSQTNTINATVPYQDAASRTQDLYYSVDGAAATKWPVQGNTNSGTDATISNIVLHDPEGWAPGSMHTISFYLTDNVGLQTRTLTYNLYWPGHIEGDPDTTVTFLNGYRFFGSINVPQGTNITMPEDVQPGFYFKGWNTSSDGSGSMHRGGTVYTATSDPKQNLYAQWVPASEYGVTVKVDGAVSSAPSMALYKNGDRQQAMGYDSSRQKFTAYMPNDAYDIFADGVDTDVNIDHENPNATVNLYSVKFNTQGHGAPPATEYRVSGKLASEPAAPTEDTWEFQGWYKEASCTNKWNFATDTVTKATTLYAKWDRAKVTLSYDGNQADRGATDSSTARGYIDDFTIAECGFERDGYDFKEWCTDPNGQGTIYRPAVVTKLTADTTLYAQWEPHVYPITYVLDGGTVPSGANPATYKITDNPIHLTNPTRTGADFLGWEGTGIVHRSSDVTIPTGQWGNRTYVAKWNVHEYDVKFDANGGKGTMDNQHFVYDQEKPLDPVTFARDGYVFDGWEDSNGNVYTDMQAVKNLTAENGGVVTLKARWAVKQPVKGTATLNADKNIVGRSFQADDHFTFNVSAPQGTPAPEKTSVSIEPDTGTSAQASFGIIAYSQDNLKTTVTYSSASSVQRDYVTEGWTYNNVVYGTTIPEYAFATIDGKKVRYKDATAAQKQANSWSFGGKTYSTAGIPAGATGTCYYKEFTYTVTEANEGIGGITYDTKQLTPKVAVGCKNGKIYINGSDASTNSVAVNAGAFTNKYEAKAWATLKAKKVLDGGNLQPGQFTFTVTGSGPAGHAAPMPASNTASNAADGTITFDSITFTQDDLEGAPLNEYGNRQRVFSYTIKENKPSKATPGYTYTDRTITVNVTVVDNGDGTLLINSKPGGSNVDAGEFGNSYQASGTANIVGHKQLNGRALGANQFEFHLLDNSRNVVATSTNAANGNVVFPAIKFSQEDMKKSDGTFETSKTFTYIVQEVVPVDNMKRPGYTYATTGNEKAVTFTVTDAGNGKLLVNGKENGTVDADAIINDYKASGSVDLDISKKLDGRTMNAGEFKYTLTGSGKNMTSENTAAGKIPFHVDYTQADAGKTFTYTIKEVNTGQGGVTFDTNEVTATVTVTDNGDGTLKTAINYTYAGRATAAPTFVNTYKASAVTTMVGKKVLNGRTLRAGEFGFTIMGLNGSPLGRDSQGREVSRVRNAADGTLDFGTSIITQASVARTAIAPYTYVITEDGGNVPGIVYDRTMKLVTVRVIDDGDGTLTAEASVNGTPFTVDLSAPNAKFDVGEFVNNYEAETGATFKAHKTLQGSTALADGQFTFDLYGPNNIIVSSASNDAEGNVVFPDTKIVYARDDSGVYSIYGIDDQGARRPIGNVGQDIQFTIREQLPDGVDSMHPVKDGMEYDVAEHSAKVRFDDNGDGTLTPTYTYMSNQQEVHDYARFTNIYRAKATGDITVSKTLVGRPILSAGLSFKAVMTEGPAVPESWSVVDGKATRDATLIISEPGHHEGSMNIPLTVDKVGTYKFDITEIKKDEIGGMEWDQHTAHVTAVVTDNGDGTLKIESMDYDNSEAPVVSDRASRDSASFTNTYTATASTQVKVTKDLQGRKWTGADKFDFVLQASGRTAEGTDVKAVPLPEPGAEHAAATAAAHTAVFGDVTFTSDMLTQLGTGTGAGGNGVAVGRAFDDFYYDVVEYTPNEAQPMDAEGKTVEGITYGTATDDQKAQYSKWIHDGVSYEPGHVEKAKIHVVDDANGKLTVTTYYDNAHDGSYKSTIPDAITNTYEKTTTTVELFASKDLQGRDWLDDETFDLTLKKGSEDSRAPMPEGSTNDEKTVTVDSGDKVSFGTITLDSTLTEAGSTTGYYYEVVEAVPDDAVAIDDASLTYGAATAVQREQHTKWFKDGLTYTSAAHRIEVDVTDDGKGHLSATVGYENDADNAVVTNTYYSTPAEVSLKGAKTMSGRDLAGDRYSVEVVDQFGTHIADMAIKPDGTYEGVPKFLSATGSPDGDGTFENPYPAGEYIVREVVPDNAKMVKADGTIDEDVTYKMVKDAVDASGHDNQWVEGRFKDVDTGVTYDAEERICKIDVTDDMHGTQSATVSYDMGKGDDGNPLFENSYAATGTAHIVATKFLVGAKWDDPNMPGMKFEFNLSAKNGKDAAGQDVSEDKIPMPDGHHGGSQMVVVDGATEGYQARWDIGLNQDDVGATYVYELQEQEPNFTGYVDSEWTCDREVHTVTVKPYDDNGTVKAEITYSTETGTAISLIIRNKHNGSIADFLAKKELTGRAWTAQDSFALRMEAQTPAAPMPADTAADGTKTVNATADAQTVSFGDIEFADSADGTYRYKIYEPESTTPGVTGDATVYIAEVKVETVGGVKTTAVTYKKEGSGDDVTYPTFKNTYTTNTVTVPLVGQKALNGRDWIDEGQYADAYTFDLFMGTTGKQLDSGGSTSRVIKSDSEASGADVAQYYDVGSAGKIDHAAEFGTVTFGLADLKGAKSKQFDFAIREQIPDDAQDNVKDGVVYSSATHSLHVIVTDNGDGTLTAKVSSVSGDGRPAVITNVYSNTPTIVNVDAKKLMEGRTLIGGHYVFQVIDDNATLAGGAPNPAYGKLLNQVAVGSDGNVGLSIPTGLTDGYYENDDAYFKIKENIPIDEAKSPGVTYDDSYIVAKVHIVDNNDGTTTATVVDYSKYAADGTLIEGGPGIKSLTNVYKAQGSATVSVDKQLFGRAWNGDSFQFTLNPEDGAPMHVEGQATDPDHLEAIANAGNQMPSFAALQYNQDDLKTDGKYVREKDFVYRINEVEGDDPSISYDKDTVYYAKVHVSDRDRVGSLTPTVTYYTDKDCTQQVDEAEFSNSYASAGSVNFSMKKVLSGANLKDFVDTEGKSLFKFTLRDANNDVLAQDVAADPVTGDVNFTINYTQDDMSSPMRRYFVAEQLPADATMATNYTVDGIKYFASDHSVEVTLQDDGHGTITATPVIVDPVFTNEYVGKTTATIGASKHLDGRPIARGGFSFTLTDVATGTTIRNATINVGDTWSHDAHGTFREIEYTQDDLRNEDGTYADQKDFTYKISEVKGSNAAIDYTDVAYYAKVTVKNDITAGQRGLSTEVAYFTDEACTNAVPDDQMRDGFPLFTNVYTTHGTVNVKSIKDLSGRSWTAEDKFGFTIKKTGIGTADGSIKTDDDSLANVPMPEGSDQAYAQNNTEPVIPGLETEYAATFNDINIGIGNLFEDGNDGLMKGNFFYEVTENIPAGATQVDNTHWLYEGVTYTAEHHTVHIQAVDDRNGGLVCNVYYDESKQGDPSTAAGATPVFANTYAAHGEGKVAAAKTINDRYGVDVGEWKDDYNFTFDVTAIGNAPHAEHSVAIIGKDTEGHRAEFGNTEFHQTGEFVYAITERSGEIGGIDYDIDCISNDTNTVYALVRVVDNGDGTLDASDVTYYTTPDCAAGSKIEADAAPFTNIYTPHEVNLQAVGKKTITGRGLFEHEFNFEMSAIGGVDHDGKPIQAVDVPMPYGASGTTITANNGAPNDEGIADVDFGTLTFTEEGTYSYATRETSRDVPGVTVDESIHYVDIVVEDTGDQLVATPHFKAEGETTEALVFTNEYRSSGTANVKAIKDLSGRAWLATDDFAFKMTPVEGAPMPAQDTAHAVKDETQQVIPGLETEYAAPFDAIPITQDDLTIAANGVGYGDFFYEITEVIPEGATVVDDTHREKDGITYTTEMHVAHVHAVDDTAGNITTQVYYDETTPGDPSTAAGATPVFANTYKAESTGNNVTVSKRLVDGNEDDESPWPAGTVFNFKLDALGDAPVPAEGDASIAEDTADHKVTFGNITFTQPGTYTYALTEVEGDDSAIAYDPTTRYAKFTVKDTNKGGFTVKVEYFADAAGTVKLEDASFTNVYNAAGTANLTAQKLLDGRDLAEGQFIFTVTDKTDASVGEAPMPAITTVGNKADGSVDFGNIVFDETDSGKTYTYEVAENHAGAPGYTYADAQQVTIEVVDNHDGSLSLKINDGEEQHATNNVIEAFAGDFDNVYTAQGAVTITAGKTLANRTLGANAYQFELKDHEGNVLQTVGNRADGTVTFEPLTYDQDDLADVNDEGEVTSHSNKTFTYTVNEVMPSEATAENNYTVGGITYDPSVYTVEVNLSDDGDGTMSINGKDASSNEVPLMVLSGIFDNVCTPNGTGNVSVAKQLNGREWKDNDSFEITLSPVSGAPAPEVDRIALTTGGRTATFGNITFHEAGTFVYELRETRGDDAHMRYDDSAYYAQFTVTNNNDGTLTPVVEYFSDAACTQVVNSVVFENNYQADIVSVSPWGTKTLEGRTLEDKQFKYYLADANTGQVLDITYNDDNGDVDFDYIDYDVPGTHNYKFFEVLPAGVTAENPTKDGYTYDTTVHDVRIEVYDDAPYGTLNADIYYDGEADAAYPRFVNRYAAIGSINIVAHKVLEGTDLQDGQFTFRLKDEHGHVIREVKNDAEGNVDFGEFKYDESDMNQVFNYTAEEVNEGKDGYTYASQIIPIQVRVDDNGNGTLDVTATSQKSASGTLDLGDFGNQYQAAGFVQITATKALTGRTLEAGQFTYELKDAEGNVLQTKPCTAEGTITFDAIPYTQDDVDKTFTYTVNEVKPIASMVKGGYTYDETVKTITVVVTDNGDGKLKINQTVADPSVEIAAGEFKNAYDAEGEAVITATKKVEGHDVVDGKFAFELKDEAGNVLQEKSNDADGNVTFDAIRFNQDQLGTYKYTINEIDTGDGGYTFDNHVENVTVTVTDTGYGKLNVDIAYDRDGAVFTNTYSAAGTVHFSAHKTLLGTKLEDREFTFTIRALNGAPLPSKPAAQNAANGDIDFGTVEFDAMMANPMVPYTYAIEELDTHEAGVSYDTNMRLVSFYVVDDGDGTLSAKATPNGAPHDMTNVDYEAKPADDIVNAYSAAGTATVDATKTLDGGDITPGMFTFDLVDEAGNVVATAASNGDGEIVFDDLNFVKVYDPNNRDAALIHRVNEHGEYVETHAWGEPFVYTVNEILPEGATVDNPVKDGYTYDTSTHVATIKFTDNRKGALIAAITFTKNDNREPGIVFNNSFAQAGADDMAAKVAIDGRDWLDTDEFTVTATPLTGSPAAGQPTVTFTKGAEQPVTFGDITFTAPGTYTYELAQTPGDIDGITYDASKFYAQYTVTDNGDGTLDSSVRYYKDAACTQPIDEDEPLFTNIYNAAGRATVNATKVLEGRTLETGQFAFDLKDENGRVVSYGYNDEQGNIELLPIGYKLADVGEHVYTMTERSEGAAGYTYDQHAETVRVNVTDNGDSTLTTRVTYDGDAKFTNKYTASNEAIIQATKRVEGHAIEAGKFSFQLKDETGKVLQTKTNDANGGVTFDAIAFDQDQLGEHAYTVTEVNTGDGGYAYDDHAENVAVTVTDNGNGTLSANIAYDADGAVFTNVYTAKGIGDAQAEVKIDGRDYSDTDEFPVTLTALPGSPAPVAAEGKATKDDQKPMFGQIKFTRPGTYTYEVAQTPGTDPNLTYDASRFYAQYTVTDKGDGTLSTKVAYFNDVVCTKAVDHPVFTNIYKAAGTVTLNATKVLKGSSLEPVDFAFVVEDEQGQIVTVATNDADGNVEFVPIGYTLADVGEHVYTMTEYDDGWEGYTFDHHAETVKVKVTDNGDGTLATEAVYDADGATFTNVYNAEGKVVIEAAKQVEGHAVEAGKFTFELKDAQGKVVGTAVNDAEGKVRFDAITFNQDQLGDHAYTIDEVQGADGGYTYDGHIENVTVKVVDHGDGTLGVTAEYDDDLAVFTNTYAAAGTDSAQAKVEIDGRSWNDDDSFELTLTPLTGSPAPEVASTKATKADQEPMFGDIPFTQAGTYTYEIAQTPGDDPNMTYDASKFYAQYTVTDNDDGTLGAEVKYYKDAACTQPIDEPVFTNVYKAAGVANIEATKTLTGRTLAKDQFVFELIDAEGQMVGMATNDAQGKVAFAPLAYTLADVGEHAYTIAEYNAGAEGYIYDDHVENVHVKVTDNGDGTLATEVVYDGDGATFANAYKASNVAIVEAKKTVSGHKLVKDKFAFELKDEQGRVVSTATNDADGSVVFGAISFDETQLGDHAYTITEIDGKLPGYHYDSHTENVNIKVTDNGDGTVTAVAEYGPNGAVFYNSYAATGMVRFVADKNLTGRDLEAGQFTFKIHAMGGAPEPAKTTVTNAVDGTVDFGTAAFTQAMANPVVPYTYAIEEIDTHEAGYTYDTTMRIVNVYIIDNGDGTLSAKTALDGEAHNITTGAFAVDAGAFNNTYASDGTAVIEAHKTLEGRDLEAGQFKFELKDAEGEPISTAVNDADGKVEFESISYEHAGDYRYTINEMPGNAAGYTYDDHTEDVWVKVIDKGDGTFSAEVTYDGDGATFANSYRAQGTAVLEATKKVDGHAIEAGKFRFEAKDAQDNVVATATNDADGKVIFDAITFTQDQVGANHLTINEVAGNDTGYTYDDHVVDVWVNVTDNGDGTLGTQVSYDANGAVFTNTYAAESTSDVTAASAIDGRAWKDGDAFELTIAPVAGAPAPAQTSATATADGQPVTFGDIEFTRPGTYTYEIAQTPGTDPNLTYDTTKRYAQFTVTDNGDGTMKPTVAYFTDAACTQPVDRALFTNVYAPTPTKAEVSATKVLAGRTLQVREFTFVLASADGKVKLTATNDAEGNVKFAAIPFVKAGTYNYVLTEDMGTAAGVTYDPATHNVTITVVDNDGALEAKVSYDGMPAPAAFKNTYEAQTMSIDAQVVWNDDDNRDGARQPAVLHLMKTTDGGKTWVDAGQTKTIPVDATGDQLKVAWTDLPSQEGDDPVFYKVAEDGVDGYATTVEGDPIEGYVVTNTRASDLTRLIVAQKWEDANDQDGMRPVDVEVHLLADGKDTGKSVVLNADNNWKAAFVELPAKMDGADVEYTVAKDTPEGYTSEEPVYAPSGTAVTLTDVHEPETITVKVVHKWEGDHNDALGLREDVPMRLILRATNDTNDQVNRRSVNADGNDAVVGNEATIDMGEVVVSDAQGARNQWTDVPTHINGHPVEFVVVPAAVPGYADIIEPQVATLANVGDGFTVIDRMTAMGNKVTASVDWIDADDQDGVRPDSIKLTLVKKVGDKTEDVDSITVKPDQTGAWPDTIWDNLPVTEGDDPVVYSVKCSDTKNYANMVAASEEPGVFNVVYVHVPETRTVTATKVWADYDNAMGKRPDFVTLRLLANGEDVEDEKIVYGDAPTAEELTAVWDDLPAYADGKEIAYTVTEDMIDVDGYTSAIAGDAEDGYIVTNTYNAATQKVKACVDWAAEGGDMSARQDAVVRLMKRVGDGDPVEVAGAARTVGKYATGDSATVTWDDLPSIEDGLEVTYFVAQDGIDKYQTTVSDGVIGEDGYLTYDITNTKQAQPEPEPGKEVRVAYFDPLSEAGKQILSNTSTTDPASVPEATAPAHDGYTFTAWDMNYDPVLGDFYFIARYAEAAPTKVTVSYVDPINEAGHQLLSSTETDDPSSVAPPADPKHNGMKFTGWARSVDAAGNVVYVATYETDDSGNKGGGGSPDTPGSDDSNKGAGKGGTDANGNANGTGTNGTNGASGTSANGSAANPAAVGSTIVGPVGTQTSPTTSATTPATGTSTTRTTTTATANAAARTNDAMPIMAVALVAAAAAGAGFIAWRRRRDREE